MGLFPKTKVLLTNFYLSKEIDMKTKFMMVLAVMSIVAVAVILQNDRSTLPTNSENDPMFHEGDTVEVVLKDDKPVAVKSQAQSERPTAIGLVYSDGSETVRYDQMEDLCIEKRQKDYFVSFLIQRDADSPSERIIAVTKDGKIAVVKKVESISPLEETR